ncbi:hypothetical protein PINS_up011171 [Pythium insidiosum]|nr:hypothetical protein PINS_up011171 [Pythium insidiosum]
MADRGGPTRKFKVVLLGEGRVGKTSILLRYIKGEYDDRQVSTLQASYLDKRLLVDNSKVQLSLWDTAGQERFHALGPDLLPRRGRRAAGVRHHGRGVVPQGAHVGEGAAAHRGRRHRHLDRGQQGRSAAQPQGERGRRQAVRRVGRRHAL